MCRLISFLLCVCMIGILGCEWNVNSSSDSDEQTHIRPVKKRLCSMVIIGNLGAEEIDFSELEETDEAGNISVPEEGKLETLDFSDLDDPLQEEKLQELIRQEKEWGERQKQKLPKDFQLPKDLRMEKNTVPEQEEDETQNTTFESLPSSSTSGTVMQLPPNLKPVDNISFEQEMANDVLSEMISRDLGVKSPEKNQAETSESDSTATSPGAEKKPSVQSEKTSEVSEIKKTSEPSEVSKTDKTLNLPEIKDTQKISDVNELEKAETFPSDEDKVSREVKEDVKMPSQKNMTEEDIQAIYEEHLKAFLEINKTYSEDVKREMEAANFQNYSVWFGKSLMGDFYAVRYFEYVGENFVEDYYRLSVSPAYKRWMDSQLPYIRVTSSFMGESPWLEMTELVHYGSEKLLTSALSPLSSPVSEPLPADDIPETGNSDSMEAAKE
ncbi:MAG: hypothetical protein Q4C96_04990 [Planctomycetia bacterium]|nr:hypothetical protein [Planctomycetia bacterium]